MRPGQQPPDPAHQPHRHAGVVADGGRRPGPGDGHRAAVAHCAGLEQHQVAGGGGRPEAGRRHLLGVDVGAPQAPGQARPLAQGVDDEHVEVAPPHEGLADHLGPAKHADGGVVGQGVGQLAARRVGGDLVGRPVRLPQRVGGGQHPGAQPPQRGRGHVAVDDAPARRDQAGRIEARGPTARPPSPGPAAPDRRPMPGPRTGAARSGAPGGRYRTLPARRRPARTRPPAASATFLGRGDGSPRRAHAHPAQGRGPHGRAVADRLPPGVGGRRSVHERERVGARRGGADHAGAVRARRCG